MTIRAVYPRLAGQPDAGAGLAREECHACGAQVGRPADGRLPAGARVLCTECAAAA